MKTKILRGQALSFKADPFIVGDQASIHYESDGLIFLQDGKVTEFGSYKNLKDKIPAGAEIKVYTDSLIIPGFVDTHVHYPQTQIIGAYGKQLIDWLNNYTFIAEQQFADYSHAEKIAKVFVQESLRAGTTTSAVFCTVHPHSVDAIFEEAQKLNLRMVAGKVLMDRNAPAALTDTAQSAYDDSKALIKKWHGKGRLSYAVTPRFAPTSSPEQLELAGALWKESPGTYMHTHISENLGEIAWVKDLFPERKSYLDVYDHYGLVGERSLLAHGVHLTEEEFTRIHKTGACVCHCSTSNEFLGSGLFPFERAKDKKRPVRVGLGTDIGAGTSFSHLQTMNESYKIAQLQGYSLSSACAFYLATKGGANSLYLDDKIGSIAPGMEADLVVLDLKSTPLMDFRMSYCKDIHEVLFILMTLGDDRATKAVYVAGTQVYGE
ncbi:guanine deaminase [Bacteriovorax sp. PP10]|uniref:Guanine deaminase n=1 Tax=Bacteriovorax antarcticus TaxID=3088717 RepID=A0ABU5VXV0_9BACT|nr:guanine deaminase [Bacteriovorax sp. PP10]MEA9357437.1 guanine deaminase [Bacteriovorax sp. PP10]